MAEPRERYRTDPRPEVAAQGRAYADQWSVYVQWRAERRELRRRKVDTASLDRYFDEQIAFAAQQLIEAVRRLPTPAEAPEGADTAPDQLDKS